MAVLNNTLNIFQKTMDRDVAYLAVGVGVAMAFLLVALVASLIP